MALAFDQNLNKLFARETIILSNESKLNLLFRIPNAKMVTYFIYSICFSSCIVLSYTTKVVARRRYMEVSLIYKWYYIVSQGCIPKLVSMLFCSFICFEAAMSVRNRSWPRSRYIEQLLFAFYLQMLLNCLPGPNANFKS